MYTVKKKTSIRTSNTYWLILVIGMIDIIWNVITPNLPIEKLPIPIVVHQLIIQILWHFTPCFSSSQTTLICKETLDYAMHMHIVPKHACISQETTREESGKQFM